MRAWVLVVVVLGAAGCGGDDDDGGGGHADSGAPPDAASIDGSPGAPDAAGMLDAAAPPAAALWVAYLADALTVDRLELFVVDVASGTPGEALRVNADLVSSGVTEEPQWSPDGQWLLYHAAQDLMFTHELHAARLTNDGPEPAVKIHPALAITDWTAANGGAANGYDWSPDGSRIRFHGKLGDDTGVYAVDTGTPGTADHVNAAAGHEDIGLNDMAAWSPDSRTLLYQVLEPGENLYAVDVSGARPGAPVQINPAPAVAGGRVVPSAGGLAFWSPDGSKILYRGDLDADEQYELYVTSFAGGVAGDTRKVNGTLVAGGDVTSMVSAPFWSPDGSKVLYRADQEVDDRFDLYVVDMTGEVPGVPQRVNPDLESPAGVPDNPPVSGLYFAWSPDSTRVAYMELQSDFEFLAGSLWVVDVTGPAPGTPEEIRLNAGIVPYFSWAPDSSHVAFLRRVNLAIYVADTSTAEPGAPVRIGSAVGLTGNPGVSWSPNSARLAFRGRIGDDPFQVWLADPGAPNDAVPISAPAGDGGEVTGGPIRWCFDSQRLLYEVRHPPHYEVWLVDISSGAPAPAVKVNGPLVDGGNLELRQYWFAPAFTP
jgi:Tol biopolymer transport system component